MGHIPPLCPYFPQAALRRSVSTFSFFLCGLHTAGPVRSDWIALEHIPRPFAQRGWGKGTLSMTWSKIASWLILISSYYYWDGERQILIIWNSEHLWMGLDPLA